MLDQLRFYVRHSINDLRVNGRRTIFALLCIAAGVAAIVSLQTLGVMINDSLTGSLQESNGGDIKLLPAERGVVDDDAMRAGREAGVLETAGTTIFGGGEGMTQYYFTPEGYAQIKDWFSITYPGAELTAQTVVAGGHGPLGPSLVSNLRTDRDEMFLSSYIIDAAIYPLYGTRETLDGQPLNTVLIDPTDVVISQNLADALAAEIGDTLRINGSRTDFTLTGIVAMDAEGGVENIGNSLFGYFYLDIRSAPLFDTVDLAIKTIYVKLPEVGDAEAVQAAFHQEYDYLYSVTTDDLEAENTEVSDTLNQLVMVMGLVSLLIGGIGIVNTMTVVVSRRTNEIAVLKTIGLEGGQITALFLVEAVLIGIIGSVLGVGFGWLGTYVFKGIASVFVAQRLTLRITPEPALLGFVVGVLVTTIFGFMPTLSAGNVRPSLVLRPSDNLAPHSGRSQSMLALLVVLVALSLVAQPLINDLLAATVLRLIAGGLAAGMGLLAGVLFAIREGEKRPPWKQRISLVVGLIAAGFGFGYLVPALLILTCTFVVVGLLYVILWTLILVIGRFFPAGSFVDLKIALRSMVATRGRGATTLLALVIGVFTLSLITMLASSISNRLQELLESEAGGNVMIFASGQAEVVEQIEDRLGELDGVRSYTVVGAYNVELIEFEDVSAGEVVPYDKIRARVDAAVSAPAFGPGHGEDPLTNVMSTIDERGVNSNLPDVDFYKGRQLNKADTGLPHIVIPANDTTLAAGFDVGDKLTFELVGSPNDERITFEIVGMIDRTGNQVSVGANSQNYAPHGSFPADLQPDNVNAVVDVDPDQIGELRDAMDGISGAFVMETRMLNELVNRMINRFTSFPILVASLSLVVGGIVIANSVALSTLERRREIGIMKAMGLQRERVLDMILLENGLMGFIGGLIGVALSSVILLVLMIGVFGGSLGTVIPYMTAFGLMGMCVLIALVASILTAWQASGEKPLNVLRYD